MKKIKSIICIVCVLFIILMIILGKNFNMQESYMNITLSKQDDNIYDLLKATYTKEQLINIVNFKGTIRELNSQYKIECLKKYEHGYRVVYKGDSSMVVINFDSHGKTIFSNLYSNLKAKREFAALRIGESIEIVQRLDLSGDYAFLYSGRDDLPYISNHYTSDGFYIQIFYNEQLLIDKISVKLI